jgi:hypothetical protein
MLPGEQALEFHRKNRSYGDAPNTDSLRTHIQQVVGDPLQQCGFSDQRFDLARDYFQRVGHTSGLFMLVWDATSVLPVLGYQQSTDSVVGLVIPDELLGQTNLLVGDSLTVFLERIRAFNLATQLEVVLLVPLAPHMPAFLLGVFAQSSGQTTKTIECRMRTARSEMEKRGAFVVGVAADGASCNESLMRSMRQRSADGRTILLRGVPTLEADAADVALPARVINFRNIQRLVADLPVLDPPHHLNLYRNAGLRDTPMQVGSSTIVLARIKNMIEQELGVFGMPARLGVRATDFDTLDRMNFASAQRLFNTQVLDFVEAKLSSNDEMQGAHAVGLCGCTYSFTRRCSVLPARWQSPHALLPRSGAHATGAHRVRVLRHVCRRGLVLAPEGKGGRGQDRQQAHRQPPLPRIVVPHQEGVAEAQEGCQSRCSSIYCFGRR